MQVVLAFMGYSYINGGVGAVQLHGLERVSISLAVRSARAFLTP